MLWAEKVKLSGLHCNSTPALNPNHLPDHFLLNKKVGMKSEQDNQQCHASAELHIELYFEELPLMMNPKRQTYENQGWEPFR